MATSRAACSGLALLLLLTLCACSCLAQDRPTYAQVLAGTHKKPAQPHAPVSPYAAPPAAPAAQLAKPEEVAQAVSQFNLDVAKGALLYTEGNGVVSPIGVAHILSLLQQAASPASETAAQLERGLRLDRESSQRGVPRLLENAVTKTKAKSVLENGNNLFVNTEWRLKPEFLDKAHQVYKMNLTSVDFKQIDAAVATINKWASDSTHGRIPALVNKRSLSPRTSMVLASAMYFRGVWQRQFDAGKTVQKLFSTTPSRNVTVFMMQQVDDFRFGDLPDLDASWLELPFDGDHFSMLLVLPEKRHGVADVLRRMEHRHILSMLLPSPSRRAVVIMPRFQLTTNVELTPSLKGLGIASLFGRDAKLKGISENALSVSDVLHKAEMKVDEQGATASAASAVLVNTLSLLPISDDMKFYADHPFLAIIVDRTTKVPLFIGRVSEPIEDF